jgi:hypothetical protein
MTEWQGVILEERLLSLIGERNLFLSKRCFFNNSDLADSYRSVQIYLMMQNKKILQIQKDAEVGKITIPFSAPNEEIETWYPVFENNANETGSGLEMKVRLKYETHVVLSLKKYQKLHEVRDYYIQII